MQPVKICLAFAGLALGSTLSACVSVDREERVEHRYLYASQFGVVERIDYVRGPRRADEDVRVGILDDGSYGALVTADDPHLRIGDRVTVEADRMYFR